MIAYPPHTPLMLEAHRWMVLPTIWGQHDCMLSLADWYLRVHGFDPAAHIRFTYDSPATCQKETGFLRDPLSATRDIAEVHGGLARKITPPVKGDIALLRLISDGRETCCGGMWLGRGWLIKGQPSGATLRTAGSILETMAVWDMRYVDP
jgi:hypothetical protein